MREEHPTDGKPEFEGFGVNFEQPKTLEERNKIARTMCSDLEISIPCLVDGIDNKVGIAYTAMPDRLYVIGIDGKIFYRGEEGPLGFKPKEAAQALAKHIAEIEASKIK